MLQAIFQDLKFGARILVRSPAMTCAVLVALTLGIGATSAMFSVVDALLLHPLRFRDPASLTILWEKDAQSAIWSAAPANYLDWRKQAKSFEDIAGWTPTSYVRTGIERPEQLPGATVTANFFRTLGVKPELGRDFLAEEDGIDGGGGARKVVLIGDKFWRENMGGDPNILGRQLKLNSSSYTIVGVIPPTFQFISRVHQIWTPLSPNKSIRDFHPITVLARLRKGVPREQAGAEMAAIARGLADAYPKTNKGFTVQVDDLQGWIINRRFRTRLLLLFGAVGLVLLIACTNVASLLLARSSGRMREIAVRSSLGATSGRLVRQLLTESVLLSGVGGVLGLALAWELIRLSPKFVPTNAIPAAAPIELNVSVMLFTLTLSIVTGVLFGLAPALAVAKPDVQERLKDSTRGTTGGGARQRFRQGLAAAEVAVALMLVASAALMMESLQSLTSTELGFNPKNAMSLRLFLPPAKYDAARTLQFHKQALARLAALPGITSVALGANLPLQKTVMGIAFDLESSAPKEQAEKPDVDYITVSPQYFSALGIPVRRGRVFTETDNEGSPPVAIANQALADKFFPGQDAVGKRVVIDRPKFPTGFEDTTHAEIVGIVANVKTGDLAAPGDPILYVPHAQNVWSPAMYFAIRSAMDPTGLTAAIRNELQAMDPEQPISQVASLEQLLVVRAADPRFQTQLMGTFAALAFLLAVVGVYGVNAYAVSQRRQEIGVRMALGATPGNILRVMIGQGMKLTAAGIVLGIAGSLAIASLLKSVLVGVSATDPLTLGGVALAMALVAAVACYVPARRATRIDPATALREG